MELNKSTLNSEQIKTIVDQIDQMKASGKYDEIKDYIEYVKNQSAVSQIGEQVGIGLQELRAGMNDIVGDRSEAELIRKDIRRFEEPREATGVTNEAIKGYRYVPDMAIGYGVGSLGLKGLRGSKVGLDILRSYGKLNPVQKLGIGMGTAGAGNFVSDLSHGELRGTKDTSVGITDQIDPKLALTSFAMGAGFPFLIDLPLKGASKLATEQARKVKRKRIDDKDGEFVLNAGTLDTAFKSQGYDGIAFFDSSGNRIADEDVVKRTNEYKDGQYDDVAIVAMKDGKVSENIMTGKLSEYGITSNISDEGASKLIDSSFNGEDIVSPFKKDVTPSFKKPKKETKETRNKMEESMLDDESFYELRDMTSEVVMKNKGLDREELINEIYKEGEVRGYSEKDIESFLDELETNGSNRSKSGISEEQDINTGTEYDTENMSTTEQYNVNPSKTADEDLYKQSQVADDFINSIMESKDATRLLDQPVISKSGQEVAVKDIENSFREKMLAKFDEMIEHAKKAEDEEAIKNLTESRDFIDKKFDGKSRTYRELSEKIDNIQNSKASMELRNEWSKKAKGSDKRVPNKKAPEKIIIDEINSNPIYASIIGSKNKVTNLNALFSSINKKVKGEDIPSAAIDNIATLRTIATKINQLNDILSKTKDSKKIANFKKQIKAEEFKLKKELDNFKKTVEKSYNERTKKYTFNEKEFNRTMETEIDEYFKDLKKNKIDDIFNDPKQFDQLVNDFAEVEINKARLDKTKETFADTAAFDDFVDGINERVVRKLEKIKDKLDSEGKSTPIENKKLFDRYYESKAYSLQKKIEATNKSTQDFVKENKAKLDKEIENLDELLKKEELTVDDLPPELKAFVEVDKNLKVDVKAAILKWKKSKEKIVAGLQKNIDFYEALAKDRSINMSNKSRVLNEIFIDKEMLSQGRLITSKMYNTNMSKIDEILKDFDNKIISIKVGSEYFEGKTAKAFIEELDDGTSVIYIKDNDIQTNFAHLFHEYGHHVMTKTGFRYNDEALTKALNFFEESFKYIDEKRGNTKLSDMYNRLMNNKEIAYAKESDLVIKEEKVNALLEHFMMYQISQNKKLNHIDGLDISKVDILDQYKQLFEALIDESAASRFSKAPNEIKQYMSTMIDIINHPGLGFDNLLRNIEYSKVKGTDKILNMYGKFRQSRSTLNNDFMNKAAEIFDQSTWSTFMKTNSEFAAVQKIAGIVAGHRRNVENDVAEYKIALEKAIADKLGSDGDINLGFSTNQGMHYLVGEFASFDDLVKAIDEKKLYGSTVDIVSSILDDLDSKIPLKNNKLDKDFYKQLDMMLDAISKEKTYKPINKNFYPVRTAVDAINEIARNIGKLNKLNATELKHLKRDLLQKSDLFEMINKEIAKRKMATMLSKDAIKYKHKQMARLFDNEFYRELSIKMINDERDLSLSGNYNNQFGFNPGSEYQRNGLKLVTTRNKKDLVQTIYSFNGNHIGFAPQKTYSFGASTSILGKHGVDKIEKGMDTAILQMKLDKYGNPMVKGYDKKWHKIDKKGMEKFRKFGLVNIDRFKNQATLQITNASKIFASEMFDYSYSKMSARNRYLSIAKDMNESIYNYGIKDALDNGVLVKSLDSVKNKQDWTEIKLDNGVSYFVKKKWKHQFINTQGTKVKGLVGTVASVTAGIIDIVKNLYLVGTPAGYINSAMSSIYSGFLLSNNPTKFFGNLRRVNTEFNDYLALLAEKGKLDALGKDSSAVKKKIDEHWINDAYKNGIQATLRNAHKTLGDFEKNQALSALRFNRYFKTPNNVVKGLESIYLRPESDIGANVGYYYDKTEIIPKLALIKTKMQEGLSKAEAIQYAKMAFPDYNMNLPPELNFIGDFVPFLKFATNIPKIFNFTAEERLSRLLATKALGIGAVMGSYYGVQDGQEDWFKDNDFLRVNDSLHIYTGSWSNIPNPINLDASIPTHMLNPVELADKLIMPYTLNYGTWDN